MAKFVSIKHYKHVPAYRTLAVLRQMPDFFLLNPNLSTGIDPKTRHFRITTTTFCKTGTQYTPKIFVLLYTARVRARVLYSVFYLL